MSSEPEKYPKASPYYNTIEKLARQMDPEIKREFDSWLGTMKGMGFSTARMEVKYDNEKKLLLGEQDSHGLMNDPMLVTLPFYPHFLGLITLCDDRINGAQDEYEEHVKFILRIARLISKEEDD